MKDGEVIAIDQPFKKIVQFREPLERALCARFGVDDGLDAASEAVAYGVEHWGRVGTMENPAGYLYRVGETAGRRLRGKWTSTELLVDEPQSCDAVVDLDLQRALAKLKPSRRVAIVLVHAHGYSYRDAARVLGVTETALANDLHRGLTRLRRLVEK